MSGKGRPFVPAAGRDWALPLYDTSVRLLGLDYTRDTLLDEAQIERGHHVLEIGCGTGALLTRLKRRHPEVTAVGLDPDSKALARARRKADAAGLVIQLDQAFSDRMPYPDDSFDRVLSSFMFHHLSSDVKTNTMREVRRVLRPGGSFHLLDFAWPSRVETGAPRGRDAESRGTRLGGFLMRLFHAEKTWADIAEDRVIALMREAGFGTAERRKREMMLFGRVGLEYYRAAA